jgi:hypothetical protein
LATATGWDDFLTRESVDWKPHLIWASQGVGGSGKSHFLLTAPEPIWIALFDPEGIEPLLNKAEFKDKDIRWRFYDFNPGDLPVVERPAAAKAALDQFKSDYALALLNARTIGFDKEEHVWELLRYARLDAYTDRPAKYYELNNQYRSWVSAAAKAGVNLGLLRGMKEKWGLNDNGSPAGTGEFGPRGQKEVNEQVQLVLHHRFDLEDREFKVRIGGPEGCDDPKCRIGNTVSKLIGEEFGGLDFMTLAAMLYPDLTEEDWTA